MPVVRLRPGEWLPDKGPIRTEGLAEVYGVVSVGNAYVPGPLLRGSTMPIPAGFATEGCYGMYIHEDAATLISAYIYIGTGANIYRSASLDATITDATGAAVFSAPATESGWQFASFGNNVLATNGVDAIQIATTPTTNFVASNQVVTPTSYDPYCKYITTIKNNVLIGNISFTAAPNIALPASALSGTSYPTMVMWSANDNARRFGDPKATPDRALLGSDWQDFPDEHGPITGLVGGEYALIFKKSAIYRMDGPPWTFAKIVSGSGCIYPNSIVKHYDNIYYWGPGGPTVLVGGGGEPVSLSAGKCQRAIQDASLGKFLFEPTYASGIAQTSLYGAVDYKNDLVVWSFPSATLADSPPWALTDPRVGAMLVYSIKDDRFSIVRAGVGGYGARIRALRGIANSSLAAFETGAGSNEGTPGYPLSNLYGVYTVVPPAGPESVAIKVFQALSNETVGNPKSSTAGWDNPTFTFPYITLPLSNDGEQELFGATTILRVRPVYFQKNSKALDVAVTVNTCSRFPFQAHSNTDSYTATGSYQDENGWIDMQHPVSGTHHQLKVVFTEPEDGVTTGRYAPLVESFFELEIEYSLDGKFGGGYRT